MDVNRLVGLLQCVECGFSPVTQMGDDFYCGNCQTSWQPVNGIYDFRPRSSLPAPKMYQDPNYRCWQQQQADSHDYFYKGNPIFRWISNSGHRVIKRLSMREPEALTLDLACGDGAHRAFLPDIKNVIGLDINQLSLEKVRRRFPDFFVVRGDCYRLPFADALFDRVISVGHLEHLVHLDFSLEEVSRVLKPSGQFMVSVPAEGGYAWTAGRAMTSAKHFTTARLDYIRANAIDHSNCVWQVEKALKRHFDIHKRYFFPFGVPSYHLNLIVTWSVTKSEGCRAEVTPCRHAKHRREPAVVSG